MEPTTPTDLGLTIAFAVIVMINLLGNSLVCLVVLRYRGMRTPTNYLLVNLAVSDLMVALSLTPQYVINNSYKHPSGTAGDYLCKFITGGNFVWVGGYASAFSLVVIAFERYFAVVHPLDEERRLNTRKLVAVIAVGWFYALLFNLPLFFVVQYQDTSFHCQEIWSNVYLAKAFTIACFFVSGAIPIVIMAVLYSRALVKLWKSGASTTVMFDRARIQARLKVTRMVLVVSVLYALCWLPNLTLYMLSQFKPEVYELGSISYIISVLLVSLNSAMNPFIYSLHSSKFRRHIIGALCCRTYRSSDLLRNL